MFQKLVELIKTAKGRRQFWFITSLILVGSADFLCMILARLTNLSDHDIVFWIEFDILTVIVTALALYLFVRMRGITRPPR